MGWDCYIDLPRGTSSKEVHRFLEILGYKQQAGTPFFKGVFFSFYKDEHFRYREGVGAWVKSKGKSGASMHTRTSVWRSKYDNDYHNLTIKAVHERFGGKFTSDAGEGEYIPYDGFVREKAEAACYYAESRFQNAIVAAGVLLNAHKESDAMIDRKLLKAIPQLAGMQPPLIVYNLLAPYLVSCIEDFFRSVYVGLLTYSPRKQGVFKSARLSADDMVAVSEGLLKVEDAVAKSMTFQNVKRIAEYYREVDPQIDLLGILRRPSNRARSGLDKRLEDLIGRRHLLIHQNVMSPEYFVEEVRADIKCLELTVKRTLSSLRRHYHWQPGYPD